MTELQILREISEQFGTPAYIFNVDIFHERIRRVQTALQGKADLCYSIKANPFLIRYLPDSVRYIEVCSPGELTICEKSGVDMRKILFSGVNKTLEDVERAMEDGVGIFTAESRLHVRYIHECAMKRHIRVPVILRLSSGNQFGMDSEELVDIVANRERYAGIELIGLHYYTGTQKKKAKLIAKELQELDAFCQRLKRDYDFTVSHVEYGPGLAVDYFGEDPELTDIQLLEEASVYIREFADTYHLGIEMGRFLAASCGTYLTQVMDVKDTHDIHYAICDGGIHQVKYYGQTMAMQVPEIQVLDPQHSRSEFWSLCGSLCTTADVLVRKAPLTGVGPGCILAFERVGAYSVCEGMSLFLSRDLPKVLAYTRDQGVVLLRDRIVTDSLNTSI